MIRIFLYDHELYADVTYSHIGGMKAQVHSTLDSKKQRQR